MEIKDSIPASKADKRKLGYVGKKPGDRNSNTWFTPKPLIDKIREVLGQIQLDPFSSAEANKIVGAKRYIDEDEDAFRAEWTCKGKPVTVFMNPPYGARVCGRSVDLFMNKWDNGHITAAVVLVNNATETQWFQKMCQHCNSVHFPNKRVGFWNSDGKSILGNTRGQAVFYFGPNSDKFSEVFNDSGVVL